MTTEQDKKDKLKKYKFTVKDLNIMSGSGRLLVVDHIANIDERNRDTMGLVKIYNGVAQDPPKRKAKKKGDKD